MPRQGKRVEMEQIAKGAGMNRQSRPVKNDPLLHNLLHDVAAYNDKGTGRKK